MTSSVRVPVLQQQDVRSWPVHADGGRAQYLPLADALARSFPSDAHFAAYSHPEIERRLSRGAILSPEERGADDEVRDLPAQAVSMVLFVADLDCAAAHKGDAAVVGPWWEVQRPRVLALLRRHPGGFAYRTRRGYRLVYLLPEPVVLNGPEDADGWSLRYVAYAAYLEREFGIVADLACKDWSRLYRLPHATREPWGPPERLEIIGDSRSIGTWVCEIPSLAELKGRPAAARRAAPAVAASLPHLLGSDEQGRRARAYLAKMPGGVCGEHGSIPCFRAACVLIHGFGLSQDDAFALLRAEYSPRCTPPWSEKELRHKVEDAAKQPGVRGFVLEAQRGVPTWATEAVSAPRPARIVLPQRVSKRMLELLRTGRDARYTAPDGTLDLTSAVFGAAISMLNAGMEPRQVTQAIAASALRAPLLARGPGGLLWMAERVDAARRTLEQDGRRRHA